MKEYFSAAIRIARDTKNSCESTCKLAHASSPVNPTARILSGSGLRSSPSRRLNKEGSRRSFPIASSTAEGFPSPFFPSGEEEKHRKGIRLGRGGSVVVAEEEGIGNDEGMENMGAILGFWIGIDNMTV